MTTLPAPCRQPARRSAAPTVGARDRPWGSGHRRTRPAEQPRRHRGCTMGMSTASNARGRVRIEPGAKRVRAYLEGRLVVDTLRPLYVWEIPYYPAYYVPSADVV